MSRENVGSPAHSQISEYLKVPGGRFMEGIALLERYGNNPTLVFQLKRQGVTRATVATLREELGKLALRRPTQGGVGVVEGGASAAAGSSSSDGEAATMSQRTGQEEGQRTGTAETTEPATGTASRYVKFRQQFPFLDKGDCPECLKVLVSDMFTAYGRYKDAHNKLVQMPDDADLKDTESLARQAVEELLKNQDMWEELMSYRDNHVLLGITPVVAQYKQAHELEQLSDLDLMKQLQSAKSNQSKARRSGNEQKLVQWTQRRQAVEAEVERRKKN